MRLLGVEEYLVLRWLLEMFRPRRRIARLLGHRLALKPLPPLSRRRAIMRKLLFALAFTIFAGSLLIGAHPTAVLAGFVWYLFVMRQVNAHQMRNQSERFVARHAKSIDRMLAPGEQITMSSGSRPLRIALSRLDTYEHVLVTDQPRVLVLRPRSWPWSEPRILDSIPLADVRLVQRGEMSFWGRTGASDSNIRFGRAGAKHVFKLAMPDEPESVALAEALRLGAGQLSIAGDGEDAARGRLSAPARDEGALSNADPLRSD